MEIHRHRFRSFTILRVLVGHADRHVHSVLPGAAFLSHQLGSAGEAGALFQSEHDGRSIDSFVDELSVYSSVKRRKEKLKINRFCP